MNIMFDLVERIESSEANYNMAEHGLKRFVWGDQLLQ